MLGRLADLVHRRPRHTLVLAAVYVVFAGVFSGPVAALSHSGSNFEDPDSDGVRARERIEQASGVSPEVAVVALVELGEGVRRGAGRAKLVPSLMKLLGERNWWAPGPLRRLYLRIAVRET